MLLSLFFINVLFAQSNDGTNITGDDAGWGDRYDLIYKVDDVLYKTITLEEGAIITPEPSPAKEGYTFSGWSEIPGTMPAKDVVVTGTFSINSYNLTYVVDGTEYKTYTIEYGATVTAESLPTKEGYTFSGWSEIPGTMPAKDVTVTGSFTVNKYLLTVIVDGIVYYSDSIAYGTRLVDYIDLIAQQGIDITSWEYYEMIESISMPAHDVVINGPLDAVMPLYTDERNELIYDLRGKKLNVKDISTLQPGIYIRNGHKYIVR